MKRLILTLLFMLVTFSVLAAERPRWVGQPIYVYVPEYGNMSRLMKSAFTDWERASNSLVRFKFVNNTSNANIVVEFVDFVSGCTTESGSVAVGCTEMSSRGGEYYKAYVTIGTKEYSRSYKGGYTREIVERPKEHIYGVMLHEAGHAVGLGHSTNTNSIMYPRDLDSMQYLTKEDLQLLYNKYH